MRGHTDIVRLLLDVQTPGRAVDVHAMDDYALRQAVKFRHVEAVRLLCGAGARIRAANGEALVWAKLDKSPESAAILAILTEHDSLTD
jgi:hypothetical protein